MSEKTYIYEYGRDELSELSELFDSDSGALNNLLDGQKEAEEIINEFNSFQKQSENILSFSTPTIVDYYVECIKELLDSINVKSPILIGHSFGGKISLAYASKYDTEKLILFGSPFRPAIKKLSLKTKLLKKAKKIPVLNKLEGFAKRHIGSDDYKSASDMMRKILVDTVNLDITEDVKKIKCPTLIVWGTLDEAVPVEDAYILEKLIPDSGIVIYEGCSHYAYLERLSQVVKVIRVFIK